MCLVNLQLYCHDKNVFCNLLIACLCIINSLYFLYLLAYVFVLNFFYLIILYFYKISVVLKFRASFLVNLSSELHVILIYTKLLINC